MAAGKINSRICLTLAGGLIFIAAFFAAAAERSASKNTVTPETPPESEARTNYPVSVRKPATPRIATGAMDVQGTPVTVACSTCHSVKPPNAELRQAGDLRVFHPGLTFNHGGLSCLSCHNPGNYDTLRLADGAELSFANVQQLCGQCHGPQTRDYRNGSHGGMTGYWDLTRGPRTRNTCIDCHDPHAPQFPVVMPVFAPQPASRASNDRHK